MAIRHSGTSALILAVGTFTGLCILLTLFPYIKAEFLTRQHGNEFQELGQLTGMIDAIVYHRVLDYTDEHATVFYVSKGHVAGNLVEFSRQGNEWILSEWRTIWSTSGSADGFMWPYYR